MKVFGPVPSRRLGKSIGINNIVPKFCSYSCVYCQLGRTFNMLAQRREFYNPEDLLRETEIKLEEASKRKEKVDYLTFVADGEPTLDINLGAEIKALKKFGVKIAVISNSSHINHKDVVEDLLFADWVSLKIDSVDEKIWKRINRPDGSLNLQHILEGIKTFAENFTGEFVTETMLVKGINDSKEAVEKTADFISKIKINKAYISVPIRPPAEKDIEPPDEKNLTLAWQIFDLRKIKTEFITKYEGNAFAFTGDARRDLLSICSVHPMREDAVEEFLKKAKSDKSLVDELIKDGKLIKTKFGEKNFYIRNLKS